MSAPQSPIDAYHSPDFHHTTPGATPSSSQTRMKNQAMTNRRNSQQQNITPQISRMASERKSAGWQTLVMYAVNLKQLDVNVNMSNVMGNTVYVFILTFYAKI
jgi:hypothetical protein